MKKDFKYTELDMFLATNNPLYVFKSDKDNTFTRVVLQDDDAYMDNPLEWHEESAYVFNLDNLDLWQDEEGNFNHYKSYAERLHDCFYVDKFELANIDLSAFSEDNITPENIINIMGIPATLYLVHGVNDDSYRASHVADLIRQQYPKSFERLEKHCQERYEFGVISKYQHSGVIYSLHLISDGDGFPSRDWDTCIVGMYYADKTHELYGEGEGNAIMEAFSNWANGDVYRVIEFDASGNEVGDECGIYPDYLEEIRDLPLTEPM